LGDYRPPAEQTGLLPELQQQAEAQVLIWRLAGPLAAGTRLDFQAEAVIAPTWREVTLTSRAVARRPGGEVLGEEAVAIVVRVTGKYLQYLPAIYERDDLMGRFLMLFESFWAPIEKQIDGLYHYLDPRITPADHLPWLASWLDLDLDERWPEARIRQLIRWAIALHRSRGTKWGLLKYLEIYTGQQAEIIEQRAQNAVIGRGARLGPGIALGQGNRPHTFTVTLHLPPIEASRKREQTRLEELRRRTIESIIEIQKPAHTLYTLNLPAYLEPDQSEAQATAAQSRRAPTERDEIAAQAAIWFKLDD
jgi:phage tail-like protein